METITDLKCAIWDIENEQKGLQNRFTQLEQAKQPLYQRLSALLTPQEPTKKE
jgi:predicted double-glycine peptidase